MLENSIPVNDKWIIPDQEVDSSDLVAKQLPQELSEVFVCNCDAAAATSSKLDALNPPTDIHVQIGGFNNYLQANYKTNEFTTYDVNMEKMCKQTVDTLFNKITGKEYIKGMQIVTGHVIER